MTVRERTAYWVQSHSPEGNELLSPSIPPSVLSDVSYEALSETESSRSVPPRMVLRYGGGRPDVPIPFEDSRAASRVRRDDSTSTSSRTTSPTLVPISTRQTSPYRSRSGSHGGSPLARQPTPRSPLAPEEIRILPSQPQPRSPTTTASSNQPRSRSLPRTTDLPSAAPPLPGPTSTPYSPTDDPGAAQTWHSYARGRSHQPRKQPPAIIYAPSHTSSRPRYAPPAMFHHPPPIGPDGMVYSHSAPVQGSSRHQPSASIPTTMVPPSRGLALLREEERRAGTWSGGKRERPQLPPLLSRSPSSSSMNSQGSGSTYYVLPSAGQKVHVIVSCLTKSRTLLQVRNAEHFFSLFLTGCESESFDRHHYVDH